MGYYPRTAGPAKPEKYSKQKTALSKEFGFRCAFCDTTEFAFGSWRNFHVEHFRPKGLDRFAGLIDEWSNLYYSCGDCNTFKNDFWPNDAEEKRGYVLVDPGQEDVFAADIRIQPDGTPEALTERGRCMIVVLAWDRPLEDNRPDVRARWRDRNQLTGRIARVEMILDRIGTPRTATERLHKQEMEQVLAEDKERYQKYFLGWDTRSRKKRKT